MLHGKSKPGVPVNALVSLLSRALNSSGHIRGCGDKIHAYNESATIEIGASQESKMGLGG